MTRTLTEHFQVNKAESEIKTFYYIILLVIEIKPSLPHSYSLDPIKYSSREIKKYFQGWSDLGRPRSELLEGREREVRAVVKWVLDNPFVLREGL